MRLSTLLPALALIGCNEYQLNGTTDPGEPVDTDEPRDTAEPVDTDVPVDEDCADQTIPGYDGSVDADCENEVEVGTFTPVVEWYKPTWSVDPSSNQIMSAPILVQLNDDDGDSDIDVDDTPDIVVVTYGSYGTIRAVSGDGSGELWSRSGDPLQGQGGVAAGDIDGDGMVEILSMTSDRVKAYEHDGTPKWTSPSIAGHIYGISDVAAISDMDGDGDPEIIAGRAILNSDGTLQAAGNRGFGGVSGANVGSCAFAVDMDADGTQEVVTGNAAYKPDGSLKWSNGLQDGYPAVADFDGDGQAEVAVSGQGQMRLLDTDGTQIWAVAIPGAGSGYYGGPPTIADFDGDGEPEIGVAAGSRYSVIEGDGSILWQAVTDDSSSGNTGSSVFDFEGDGVAEVVYADQSRLWVFNGTDGSVKLASTDHSNATWLEYPIVADVDGDDHAEIVAVNTAYMTSYSGFHVFGDKDNSWQPGRKIWNQHAYHITNIDDDGTIPSPADLNWLSYNNFRSGDILSGEGLSAPDLTIAQADICEIDCDEDKLIVWVQPGNLGAADVTPEMNPKVEFYWVKEGVETLVESRPITDTLEVGAYQASMQFELTGVDPDDVPKLLFRISSDDLECDESNNELEWKGPFCD
jgi:hypothetical protein